MKDEDGEIACWLAGWLTRSLVGATEKNSNKICKLDESPCSFVILSLSPLPPLTHFLSTPK